MARLPTLGGSLPTLKNTQPTLVKQENYGQGRGGRQWRRIKKLVHERDQWICCRCGRITMDLECDHIVNKAQGGTDDMENLQSLCPPCHLEKTLLESKAGMSRG